MKLARGKLWSKILQSILPVSFVTFRILTVVLGADQDSNVTESLQGRHFTKIKYIDILVKPPSYE